jgi:hypothetical protein
MNIPFSAHEESVQPASPLALPCTRVLQQPLCEDDAINRYCTIGDQAAVHKPAGPSSRPNRLGRRDFLMWANE